MEEEIDSFVDNGERLFLKSWDCFSKTFDNCIAELNDMQKIVEELEELEHNNVVAEKDVAMPTENINQQTDETIDNNVESSDIYVENARINNFDNGCSHSVDIVDNVEVIQELSFHEQLRVHDTIPGVCSNFGGNIITPFKQPTTLKDAKRFVDRYFDK